MERTNPNGGQASSPVERWPLHDGRGRLSSIDPKGSLIDSYTGVTRKLISTATAEWVNAPTEIKSTPV
jgi:hypothetical protein